MVIDNCSLIAVRSPLGLWEQGQTQVTVEPCPIGTERRQTWVLPPRRSCGTCTVKQNKKGHRGCPGGTAGTAQCSPYRAPSSVSGQGTKTHQPCQFSRSVGSNSATPWTAAHQASLSITNLQSSLKLMSIESVIPSSHLKLCCVPKKKRKRKRTNWRIIQN